MLTTPLQLVHNSQNMQRKCIIIELHSRNLLEAHHHIQRQHIGC